MKKDTLKIILGIAALFFAIIAVVLFILGFSLDLATPPRVILIIVAVLSLALAIELGYFMSLLIDRKPNYFLYNPQTKRNISVQKLTFQVVNARINRFLSGYATSEGKIWNERVLDNPYLDMADEFKPLVSYKLLYSLAEKDAEAGWKCLENASDDTISFICNGLLANGDSQFASTFKEVVQQKPVNISLVRDYLVRNKRYMQKKMLTFVCDNIDKF